MTMDPQCDLDSLLRQAQSDFGRVRVNDENFPRSTVRDLFKSARVRAVDWIIPPIFGNKFRLTGCSGNFVIWLIHSYQHTAWSWIDDCSPVKCSVHQFWFIHLFACLQVVRTLNHQYSRRESYPRVLAEGLGVNINNHIREIISVMFYFWGPWKMKIKSGNILYD